MFNHHSFIRNNIIIKLITIILFSIYLNGAEQKVSIIINTNIDNPKIYIMNIKAKYKDYIKLDPGSYKIKIKAPDYKTFIKTIQLHNSDLGKIKKIYFELESIYEIKKKTNEEEFISLGGTKNLITNISTDLKEETINTFRSIQEKTQTKVSTYFKIYPVNNIYREKTDPIFRKHGINPSSLSEKERLKRIKTFSKEIRTEKNSFSELISKEALQRTKYLLVIGENIEKRSSFYDYTYMFGVKMLDHIIVFFAILLPLFGFLFLLPIGFYSIYSITKEKVKPKLVDILVYIFIIITFLILCNIIYYYSINIYNSFSSLLYELVMAIFSLMFVVLLIPLFLIYLMFGLSSNSASFLFYPDGSMLEIATELTKIHLANIGIHIDLDKELLLLVLKFIILILMLKNIKLAINTILISSSYIIKWLIYFIAVAILFFSIYYFNFDLIIQLKTFIVQLYNVTNI